MDGGQLSSRDSADGVQGVKLIKAVEGMGLSVRIGVRG